MEEIFRRETGHELQIISGYRTAAEQRELEAEGRPTAPVELSTHTVCPAQGADLRIVGSPPTTALRMAFGDAAVRAGLRWGGGSLRGPDGIPSDWNHVDLGPRQDAVAQQYRADLAHQG